jgi:hypothetical protein
MPGKHLLGELVLYVFMPMSDAAAQRASEHTLEVLHVHKGWILRLVKGGNGDPEDRISVHSSFGKNTSFLDHSKHVRTRGSSLLKPAQPCNGGVG